MAMLKLVDTHAHICDPVFDADRETMLQRAVFAGIVAIIAVGENLADAVQNLPLSCLLVETDSPVLGPEPGIRNEPALLMTAVTAIAALKHVSEAEVMERVLENTRRLYGDDM